VYWRSEPWLRQHHHKRRPKTSLSNQWLAHSSTTFSLLVLYKAKGPRLEGTGHTFASRRKSAPWNNSGLVSRSRTEKLDLVFCLNECFDDRQPQEERTISLRARGCFWTS